MLIDQLPKMGECFRMNYADLGKNFETAFRFLTEADLSVLPVGRTEIDGDAVFVNVQEYTQEERSPVFEAHARYVDIQLILRGSERFCWGVGELGPLNEERDFRTARCERSVDFVLREGQFVIFLPGEAHAPGLPERGPAFCRKIVVKVLAEA